MSKNHLILFHALCTDGMCAAWIARKKYPDAEFRPMRYDDFVNLDDIEGRDVIILDLSFKRNMMLDIFQYAKSLLVLDHHKTAQAELEGLPFCSFDMKRSGAGLAWDVFVGTPRGTRESTLVDYVEDRDLWRFALPSSRQVGATLQELPIGVPGMTLDFLAWDLESESSLLELIATGSAHLKTANRLADAIAETAQLCSLGGRVCKVATTPVLVSEVGERLASEYPMGICVHQRADGKWQYSLRSRSDFDVSAVARKYGGGGHAQAAGFAIDLPVHSRVTGGLFVKRETVLSAIAGTVPVDLEEYGAIADYCSAGDEPMTVGRAGVFLAIGLRLKARGLSLPNGATIDLSEYQDAISPDEAFAALKPKARSTCMEKENVKDVVNLAGRVAPELVPESPPLVDGGTHFERTRDGTRQVPNAAPLGEIVRDADRGNGSGADLAAMAFGQKRED